MLQEEVQLGVTARVDGDFKQRQEDVLQHLLEIGQLLLRVVHVTVVVGVRQTFLLFFNFCPPCLKTLPVISVGGLTSYM